MLEAQIEKELKEFRLRVSFKIKKGEYAVILGRSGAGKSTTAKIIAGILKPDRGKVLLNKRDITSFPPERRGISYLPQGPALFPHMSVKENLEFPLKIKKNRTGKEKVKEIASRFGIERILERKPHELSGGEAKRVALARAILSGPQVIILDEPLSSLDFATRLELIEFLKELKGETTVLHITHEPLEARELADKILYLEKGEILFNGRWDEFLESRWELPRKIKEYLSP